MQSFIDTALEAEMEEHLGYPKHEKADRPNKRNGHTKKRVRSDTGELEISTPRDRDSSFEPVLLLSIKPVFQVLMTKSSAFTPKVKPLLRLSKPSRTSTTSTSQAAWFPESLTTSWMTSPLGRTGH